LLEDVSIKLEVSERLCKRSSFSIKKSDQCNVAILNARLPVLQKFSGAFRAARGSIRIRIEELSTNFTKFLRHFLSTDGSRFLFTDQNLASVKTPGWYDRVTGTRVGVAGGPFQNKAYGDRHRVYAGGGPYRSKGVATCWGPIFKETFENRKTFGKHAPRPAERCPWGFHTPRQAHRGPV
jgi:hypothetical protein